MEELVILVIFGVIIFFNFIIKKVATQSPEAAENGEEALVAPAGGEYVAPREEIREFFQQVKSQAERTEKSEQAEKTAAQPPLKSAGPAGGGVRAGQAAEIRRSKQKAGDRRAAGMTEQKMRGKKEADASKHPVAKKQQEKKTKDDDSAIHNLGAAGRSELQKAVVMSEVLGQPLGLRDMSKY